jgi:3-isopropylmalate/(R)-2-methylmalate dehydratase large subunit
MGTELSADFSIFEPDDRLFAHMEERNPGATYYPTMPDDDAVYAKRRTIDLDTIEPLVALPDAVLNQSVRISEVAGQKIDQAFIGSCANGTLEDLRAAAKVVKGRKVARGTRLIVTPGTQSIYLQALKEGCIETLIEAGAVVTNATCGACMGGHLGVLAPDEVCITSSTRNFKGRMGAASSKVYMASSATVAASALAGKISSAAEYFAGDLS